MEVCSWHGILKRGAGEAFIPRCKKSFSRVPKRNSFFSLRQVQTTLRECWLPIIYQPWEFQATSLPFFTNLIYSKSWSSCTTPWVRGVFLWGTEMAFKMCGHQASPPIYQDVTPVETQSHRTTGHMLPFLEYITLWQYAQTPLFLSSHPKCLSGLIYPVKLAGSRPDVPRWERIECVPCHSKPQRLIPNIKSFSSHFYEVGKFYQAHLASYMSPSAYTASQCQSWEWKLVVHILTNLILEGKKGAKVMLPNRIHCILDIIKTRCWWSTKQCISHNSKEY